MYVFLYSYIYIIKKKQGGDIMKDKYITIVGMNHYYGFAPFKVGKKIKCVKDKDNIYDADAIKAVIKDIGTVGYVSNTPYTTALGTMNASKLYSKVKKKFVVQVMFITNSKIICKVIDGFKEKKSEKSEHLVDKEKATAIEEQCK